MEKQCVLIPSCIDVCTKLLLKELEHIHLDGESHNSVVPAAQVGGGRENASDGLSYPNRLY